MKIVLAFLLIILALSGCTVEESITMQTSEGEEEIETSTGDTCLQPMITFDYNPETWLAEIPEEIVPLPAEWKEISAVPESFWQEGLRYFSPIFLRKSQGEEKIWFLGESSDRNDRSLITFSIQTQQWEPVIDPSITTIPEGSALEFFLGEDNTIWGYRPSYIVLREGENIEDFDTSLLIRFDEDHERFEEVPLIFEDETIDLVNLAIRKLQEDSDGKLWALFAYNDQGSGTYSIASIDPDTGYVESTAYQFEYPVDFGIIEGQVLYASMLQGTTTWLILFDLETEKEARYVNPLGVLNVVPDITPGSSIFLDQDGKLFFNANGWFDSTTLDWRGLLSDPVFIDATTAYEFWYYDAPQFYFQSKDGRMWFTSLRGSGWLDLEEQQWCIITTEVVTSMFEDEAGNLYIYIAVNGNNQLLINEN